MFIIRYDIKEITLHTTPPRIQRQPARSLESPRTVNDETDNSLSFASRERASNGQSKLAEKITAQNSRVNPVARGRELASAHDKIRLRPPMLNRINVTEMLRRAARVRITPSIENHKLETRVAVSR